MNIPSTNHYAIITEDSIHIPGDERSRTHPGHGYPAETRQVTNYQVFTDKQKWINKIESLTRQRERFVAIEAHPVKIKTHVEVKVS